MQHGSLSTSRRLLALYVLFLLTATLAPFSRLETHSHWARVRWLPWAEASLSPGYLLDAAGNVLLFLPFGYLVVRATRRHRPPPWLLAAGSALLLSTAIELAQVFSHARSPGTNDICTNVLGALIGAALSARVRSRGAASPA